MSLTPVRTGLQARGLTKRYGKRTVVDNVTFTVRPGEITGFLGPNGAGKSTTMRMLVGTSRPAAGEALVDGVAVADVPNPGLAVGVLLDAGAVHAGRTVRETMRITTHTLGLPAAVGDGWLDRVGLHVVARRRVGALSLGMRQRLGLASALVAAPRYLVLDEPMNGLDTEGIGWVKQIIRDFAVSGGGVLLSTHLIGEIDTIADRVVIIDRGRIVTEDRPSALGAAGTLVRSDDDGALVRALTDAGLSATSGTTGVIVDAEPRDVARIAFRSGRDLDELRVHQTDLTAFVLHHTAGEFAAQHGPVIESAVSAGDLA